MSQVTIEAIQAKQTASLPAVGTPLADGTFAGIHSQPDGTHVAVVLLRGNHATT